VTGNEIRETFLRFFEEKGHKRVRSSSLVPVNDPTLLFTNAGMNQFKDVFLGLEQRDYKRATTSQKCVRAGGKHNDLENVGFTNRHHTFFEMLGNFSFGDYFKKDAIAFAWELITSPDWFDIPLDRLYFTVFGGAEVAPGNTLGVDEEATELWIKTGAPRDRVFAIPGLKENFWAMGDTGPCGPCSEIHFDMGPAASDLGHADCAFPCDCGRYVEIWNLVFMQFNRDASGTLNPLPKPSVDTGMGLERIASTLLNLQDPSKISNYDTDLFVPLIIEAARLTGADVKKTENQPSLRIIADHSRAATFLISDGVIPSNEGRGYVLRKIIRRSLRHASALGAHSPILAEMSKAVRKGMAIAYPELAETADRVSKVLSEEESRFSRTVEIGLLKLEEDLSQLQKSGKADLDEEVIRERERRVALKKAAGEIIPVEHGTVTGISFDSYSGRKAFKLYDTYGLPRDFIEDVCRDAGITVDWSEFEDAMQEQRTRARASWKGAHKDVANPVFAKLAETYKTEPSFYQGTSTRDARVEAIITKNGPVKEIPAGVEAEVVLDRSAIYSESGGQVADVGKLYDNGEAIELADVKGAYYPVAGLIAHRVVALDTLRVGDRVATVADAARREHIKRNHTATHLMNAALRNILGTHVKQAGSLVEPGRLRFDFSHFAPVDSAELHDIEQQVNEEILLNNELETNIMALDDALSSGALAFFGDRYPESNVRVVTIPDANSPRGFFSKELCGGTHVKRTGDIGVFKIVAESSVAAGVRRIEAISGVRGLEEYQRAADSLRSLAATLNASPDELESAAQKLLEGRRELEKRLGAVQKKSAQGSADELVAQAKDVKGVKVISARVADMSREALRGLVDTLRQKLGSGVVALGMVENEKVALIVGVTKDLTAKVNAGRVIQAIAKEVGGSGGGRPDLAEAGGKDTTALNMALEMVPAIVDRML
jgi:alanyl-tRNA synthetase